MHKFVSALIAFTLFLSAPAMAAPLPKEGAEAPAFTLPSQDGKDVSLKDLKGKWVVLYFYPRDFTSGCSIQAHNFAVDSEKYAKKNAVIVGVSVDSVASHKEFCTKAELNFTLLSDEKGTLSDAYGSLGFLGMSSRNTFIIDDKGIIRKVYESVNPARHSQAVLADLETLQSPTSH